jgi:hypothetical protein
MTTAGLYASFPIDVHSRGVQKKRSHPRKRMVANAVMMTQDRAVPCCVHDLSPGGARVTFRDINLVPREFELLIRSTGETYRAQLRWRRGAEAGVAFVQERRAFGRRTALGSEKH